MEGLQGPINPWLFGKEHLDVESSEKQRDALVFSYGRRFVNNTESMSFEEREQEQPPSSQYLTTPRLEEEDKMPFLQSSVVGSPTISPLTEASFQVLLRLQHQNRPGDQRHNYMPAEMKPISTNQAVLEPESCVQTTHEELVLLEMQQYSPAKSDNQHSRSRWSCIGGVSCSEYCNQLEQPQPTSVADHKCFSCRSIEGDSAAGTGRQTKGKGRESRLSVSTTPPVERRKRKPAAKNKEEVESQRMTHIAVERSRRRQMNDHLNALRSLMPSSYLQRGDQASIIGGAIDFVKELEQLLQSLQAQKRMRKAELIQGCGDSTSSSSSSSSSAAVFTSSSPPEYKLKSGGAGRSDADIQVTVIQNHVNLKIQCERRPGQLLKAIVTLEDLSLTVLHLNITSLETSVHYSFNLKIEDDCKVGSADEIVGAVHQIFS